MATPPQGRADYLQLGDWNAVCFFCGFKFKASSLMRYWQGFYVCDRCWEPRQPQDFVRGVNDIQTPPWVQPDQDQFVAFCSTPTGIAGYAVSGCAINGYPVPPSSGES